jgi:hypothetical protein
VRRLLIADPAAFTLNFEVMVSRATRTALVGNGISAIEMRTAFRSPILQKCFAHPVKTSLAEAWRCVAYSISATGIGVTLPISLQERTVLAIQAWNLPRACPLKVRVVQAKQVDFLWLTGCELIQRLSDAELSIWQSGPRDWLDDYK